LALWVWFFFTSQLAQAVGMYLSLDHDGDGDVDFSDLLHWAASTPYGKIFMPQYHVLNKLHRDPFQKN
jgi:hypothetical protein